MRRRNWLSCAWSRRILTGALALLLGSTSWALTPHSPLFEQQSALTAEAFSAGVLTPGLAANGTEESADDDSNSRPFYTDPSYYPEVCGNFATDPHWDPTCTDHFTDPAIWDFCSSWTDPGMDAACMTYPAYDPGCEITNPDWWQECYTDPEWMQDCFTDPVWMPECEFTNPEWWQECYTDSEWDPGCLTDPEWDECFTDPDFWDECITDPEWMPDCFTDPEWMPDICYFTNPEWWSECVTDPDWDTSCWTNPNWMPDCFFTNPEYWDECITGPNWDPDCVTNPDWDPNCGYTDPDFWDECVTDPEWDPNCGFTNPEWWSECISDPTWDPFCLTPVNLQSFEAYLDNHHVTLEWRAAQENDLASYAVSRRAPGEPDFTRLFNQVVEGDPNQPIHSYSYLDREVHPATNYEYCLQSISLTGEVSETMRLSIATQATDQHDLPEGITVYRSYPNPANPVAQIEFALTGVVSGNLQLSVYNVTGKLVTTLANQPAEAGYYNFSWDGTEVASSGVYFAVLRVGDKVTTLKLMLVK